MAKPARRLFRRKRRTTKSRMYKSVSTQVVTQRVEGYSMVQLANVGSRRITAFFNTFTPTGAEFFNVRDILSASQSFIKYATLFKRFRIDYVRVSGYCDHTHATLNGYTFDYALNFFPQYYGNTGDTLVSEIRSSDQSLVVPNLRLKYSKKWAPVLDGPNGTGYGQWMPLNGETANSIIGQVSVASLLPPLSSTLTHALGMVTVYVGISFADKNF